MSALVASSAAAQCRPPASSHEVRLLAFYEAPTAFTMAGAPTLLKPGAVRVGVEVVPIPSPDRALEQPQFCFANTTTRSRLAPAFGRPRLVVGLPAGFAVEGSYLPTVDVSGAQATMASAALSLTRGLDVGHSRLALLVRAHGTTGRIRGAITCSRDHLQTDHAATPFPPT